MQFPGFYLWKKAVAFTVNFLCPQEASSDLKQKLYF